MNNLDILQKVEELVDDANMDPSDYGKEVALRGVKNYPEVMEILKMVYDPDVRFNISSESIIKTEPHEDLPFFSLKELLEGLCSEGISRGDCAAEWCATFSSRYSQYEKTFFGIIDKDLGCGIGLATINKVFPGLIQDFKGTVPLAKMYEERLADFSYEQWYASRKMDGIRCLCFIREDGNVQLKSRNGKEFYTLSKIHEDIQSHWRGPKGVILDGELCSINEEGDESFSEIIKLYRRKDFTIPFPLLKVFDMYTIEEFENGHSEEPFCSKISKLQEFLEPMWTLQYLPQVLVESKDHFLKLCADVPKEWEGIILRKNVPTQFKRSSTLLKVKQFQDAEYVVESVQYGKKAIDGVERPVCASLVIQHKGAHVGVGSGLSDRDRLRWYNHPELIVGKTVTIKFFSESVDQNGCPSLRFPVLKHVWEGDKV